MIQWFPGHMAKARREIAEKLKLVDLVLELVDARAPLASENPMLKDLISDKPKIVVLMKRDLAEPDVTNEWLNYISDHQHHSIAIDVENKSDIANLIQLVRQTGIQLQKRMIEKGVRERPVRAIIAGIPNVGKSTLINRLANKRIAKIGDRPGVTKKQQWIKVRNQFELLDTPGILWPKFEDPLVGKRLAVIGTIKYELIPTQDVAAFLIDYLKVHYPNVLMERYNLAEMEDMWDVFVHIGKRRGALQSGGEVNMDKVADIILQDFRTGKLGKISLETVE